MEDDLWWKMTFGERSPSEENYLQWKTTFSGRHPFVEDDLQLKRHLVENDLLWKATFGGRQTLVDKILWVQNYMNYIFSEGYRRYLALCLGLSVSAFLFVKTHIRVVLDYVGS